MANHRQITPLNAHLIPEGTALRFWYGAGCGEERGVAIGPVTNRWGTTITARMDKDGREESVSNIARVGIGVYFIDQALADAFFAEG